MEDEGYTPEEVPYTVQPRADIKLAKFMVRDRSIPKHMRDMFWAIADKEITLAKLRGREDEAALKNKLGIIKNYILMNMPPHEITLGFLTDIENLGTKWEIKMSRADEGFERQQLNTSIAVQEQRGFRPRHKPGIFERIGSKFGLGRGGDRR